MVPNLTLIDVRHIHISVMSIISSFRIIGKEVCRITTKSSEGEPEQGGRRQAEEDLHRSRRGRCPRVIDIMRTTNLLMALDCCYYGRDGNEGHNKTERISLSVKVRIRYNGPYEGRSLR